MVATVCATSPAADRKPLGARRSRRGDRHHWRRRRPHALVRPAAAQPFWAAGTDALGAPVP